MFKIVQKCKKIDPKINGQLPKSQLAKKSTCQKVNLRKSQPNTFGHFMSNDSILFDWFGISCMTIDIFCFYLQSWIIQTGGQQYSGASPFSVLWLCARS